MSSAPQMQGAKQATKFCSGCKQTFAATLENFHAHSWEGRQGLQRFCRTCAKAAAARQRRKPLAKSGKGMDWRDLAASVPQPSKPITGKLPF
jgi:hypothetical protein